MIDGFFIELIPDDSMNWRYMMGFAIIPSIIMFIGFVKYLPESPRYLVSSNQIEVAYTVLKSIRDTDQDALDELNDILKSVGKPIYNIHDRLTHLQRTPVVDHSILTQSVINNDNNNSNDDNATRDDNVTIDNNTNNDDDAIDITRTLRSRTINRSTRSFQQRLDYGSSSSSSQESLENSDVLASESSGSSSTSDDLQHQQHGGNFVTRFRHMITDVPTRRALTLGCGLMLIQQFSGVNT